MGLIKIAEGNPGALKFIMDAYETDMVAAKNGFKRMEANGITGPWLYMLWNDCCNRDTKKAIKAMNEIDIQAIKDHVYRPRGFPFAEPENNFSRITESPEALAHWICEHVDFCDGGCSKCPIQEKCLYDSDGAGNRDNKDMLIEWLKEKHNESV